MFFNRVNAANKLKAEVLRDEHTELTNEQKKEIFQKSVLKAAKEQRQRNMHAKNLNGEGHSLWVRAYLAVCCHANVVVQSDLFNNTIFFCIVLAGVLVGASTYPGMDNNTIINSLDLVVLGFFCLEVMLKIMSEGVAPYEYFVGPEWTWNNFDFLIVVFSLPILPVGGSQVAFLRLIRLMRLAKVFRKVPQLRMIMTGLIGGLKSIVYIVILLMLVFYLYAIAGIFFFRDNDPWHFRTIAVSLTSLFRLSTLSNWADMFYINYYGCDGYSGGLYVMDPSEITSTLAGAPLLCDVPMDQPWLSMAYFVSFIFICSFSMLSLFVGAITVSMSESMETMREEKIQQKKRKRLQQAEKKLKNSIKTSVDKGGNVKQQQKRQSMQQRRAWSLVSVAFKDGGRVESALEQEVSDDFFLIRYYKKLAIQMKNFTEESYFQNFITVVIIMAGVQVGMNTDAKLSVSWEKELYLIDYTIRIIFTAECVFKIIAEELQPWTYFESNWNVFDFVVVVGSYVSGGGSLIVMLRLLRLLRVLKLMRMLPQLQVIVTALMSGFSSITFISIILLLFFYFFGIIAMILFSTNDPLHFGNLHITMITLFQCSTLDNWSDILYINLYGCDVIGYDEIPEQCTQPKAAFITTSLYFIVFILMGALVLLTLFIGVVATSMEEATEEQKTQTRVDTQATKVSREHGLKYSTVCLYREVFTALDLNGGNIIDANELRLGLKAAGRHDISDKQFMRLWKSVDQDNSGGIDFSEFLLFMIALRDQKHKILSHAKTMEPEVTPSVVAKLKRPLSAPREVLRKVHDSVHSTLTTMRLQHGFGVLPVSDLDETHSPAETKTQKVDSVDTRKTAVRAFSTGGDVEMKPKRETGDTCKEVGADDSKRNWASAQLPERSNAVPGKKWPVSNEYSKGHTSPSRKNQQKHRDNYSMSPHMRSSNSFPDFPTDVLEGGEDRVDDKQIQGRSYEDRKRKYTASKSESLLSLSDSRSFVLESPYGTSRPPRTPTLGQQNSPGSVSSLRTHKKPVVSKACFI
eukprot:CAMPEP_0114448824 /NCGR_PEP_ID=MMETSP0103-20121206/20536_1 /TAXON_ID=37642 ORGANISM="Paraphysomonas imperforata, Strain PA2" /NCGR_SAMPLE_ID=MMETSP0103 /ASSEMBLY_ACC=CAM_ASM_000201 /LENGTH=1026 /DNA_ID=CAMNT_0001620875 /DNA_START=201 /DNA_END=3281 /DNA_ORIENTATION=+